jgi:UDP-glucuronate 4-epimerase
LSSERFLVTGALGCIGAWTTRVLLDEGAEVVAFDLGTSDHRLRLVLPDGQLERLVRVQGDITELGQLERALDEHGITNVIHLAALQIPLARADPPRAAAVNVVGTVNVLEAVSRRLDRMAPLVYASSVAVHAPGHRDGPAPEDALGQPATHYGVHKAANEDTARVYWADRRTASIGVRPYVVYGAGRDEGLTSAPTAAMLAAARGEAFRIPFGGRAQFHYAPDVARALVLASRSGYRGALVGNLPGGSVDMTDVAAAIAACAPEVQVEFDDVQLPFPAEVEASTLERELGPLPATPLAQGVHETVEHFRRALRVPGRMDI